MFSDPLPKDNKGKGVYFFDSQSNQFTEGTTTCRPFPVSTLGMTERCLDKVTHDSDHLFSRSLSFVSIRMVLPSQIPSPRLYYYSRVPTPVTDENRPSLPPLGVSSPL